VGDKNLYAFFVFDFNTRKMFPLYNSDRVPIALPAGVGIDGEGLIYASDSAGKKVYVFDKNLDNIKVFDLTAHVKAIGSLAIDKKLRHLIVPDPKEHKIAVFDLNGGHLFSFGDRGEGDGQFNRPLAVTVDSASNIIVGDSFNARVQRFTPEGKFLGKFGDRNDVEGGFAMIKGIAVDSEDHIYVTDGKMNRFSIFNTEGELLLTVGSTYAVQQGGKRDMGGFYLPEGIFIDQNDRIYIADFMNHRVQIYQYLNPRYLRANPLKKPSR
jgi:DNA-binding beta-propeller fold protein YncE